MKWEARVVGQGKVDPNERVFLDHENVRSADYSGRELRKFSAFGSRLERCRFDDARIDDAGFGDGREMSEYIDCSFDGLRFWHGSGFARFVRCSFKNIDVRNWLCFGTELIDCIFTGRMKGCIFNGTVKEDCQEFLGRERNEFYGNDFSGAKLIDVAFRTGIDLSKQRLPSGPEYLYLPDAPAAAARARLRVLELQDAAIQKEVILFLDSLNFEMENGQNQLLLRATNYTHLPRAVVDAVFATLRESSCE